MNKSQKPKVSRLAKKITLSFLTACLLLLLSFSAYAYILTTLNSETTVRERINSVGHLTSGLTRDFVTEKTSSLKRFSENTQIYSFISALRGMGSEAFSESNFSGIASAINSLSSFDADVSAPWIMLSDSGYVYSSNGRRPFNIDYDIRSQSWYKKLSSEASETTYPGATFVYQSMFTPDQEVFSIFEPIFDNGNLVAYCGIEVPVSTLTYLMDNYISDSASFPIISSSGAVLYAPTNNENFNKRYNVDFPPISGLVYRTASYDQGAFSFKADEKNTIHYYLDSTSVSGWDIIVIFDTTAIDGDAISIMLQQISVLALMGIIFFIAVHSVISRKLLPVSAINEIAEKFSAGEFDVHPDIGKTEKRGELPDILRNLTKTSKIITENQTKLTNASSVDVETLLPNRAMLLTSIDERIEDISVSGDDRKFAVLFADIDNFRWLNETFGHRFGDAALRAYAKHLNEEVGALGEVFRYSGDEFIVIVPFEGIEAVKLLTESIRAAFGNPLRVEETNIYFRFSVGISLYPDDAKTADDLLRKADAAMHTAKENGKNCTVYTPKDAPGTPPRKAYIAQALTSALTHREMYLKFQPIVPIKSGGIYGFEALLRWQSKDFGNIPPSDFINIAEESGEIVQLGMWIFENACRFVQTAKNLTGKEITVSVNVSPTQLKQTGYLNHIRNVLDISHINPSNILIEITEGVLSSFVGEHQEIVNSIMDMGITIALDDFGTGYSSLSNLKNLPVKVLKIDKSFIDTAGEERSDAVTDSLIDLVHTLGIITIAEGVETVEQFEKLRDMKCDYMQGYIMSKPLNENEAIEFINTFESGEQMTEEIIKQKTTQKSEVRGQKSE
jgi:diguanylate cyclase (GGDEF)-like protein